MEHIKKYLNTDKVHINNKNMRMEDFAISIAILRHFFWSDDKRFVFVLNILHYPLPIIMSIGMCGYLYQIIGMIQNVAFYTD